MQEWAYLTHEMAAIIQSLCDEYQNPWFGGLDSEGCRACPIEPACTAYRRGILGREDYECSALELACKAT